MAARPKKTRPELPTMDGDPTGPTFLGWDQSLNHAAAVLIDERGRLAHIFALVEQVGDLHPGFYATPHLVNVKERDYDRRAVEKVRAVSAWVGQTARDLAAFAPALKLVTLEGYALGMARHAHQIGEVGGHVRLRVAGRWPMRLHDPSSVKLFTTDNGAAEKRDVLEAVRDRWGVDFTHLGPKLAEDLADAYALARMGLVETQVRAGVVQLADLWAGERRVFLRTSKARPENLLARPFA